jgi:hypothetical protein
VVRLRHTRRARASHGYTNRAAARQHDASQAWPGRRRRRVALPGPDTAMACTRGVVRCARAARRHARRSARASSTIHVRSVEARAHAVARDGELERFERAATRTVSRVEAVFNELHVFLHLYLCLAVARACALRCVDLTSAPHTGAERSRAHTHTAHAHGTR